ncbi:MFS transporter [Streptomyces sp. NPDC005907]|uniref:MFS transporter n=1 Tax=Streptomyces sp. NPDC005907 TaxID=3154571 RepID=UPI0033DFFB5F
MSSIRAHAAGPPPAVRHQLVLIVTCLALGTVVAAMASLNVALPDLARETHATQTQLSWIIDSYSLVFASLLLPAGALGDRFGRRRALLAGLALFGGGSAAAALTTDPATLIGLRALLGAGAALVMPATLSTITSTFPRAQRARAVGVWAAVAGAAALVGLFATGALLETWSWPSVFLLNVALALVALIGTLLYVPESAEAHRPPLDIGGALLAVLGLVVLVYSVIEAPTRGWGSATTLGGVALGLLVLAGFVFFELRRKHPLLDPRLFLNRHFTAGSLSITLQFFVFFGFIFVMMQYLQLVRGDSALMAAVAMLPMAVCLIPLARAAPRLVARFGLRGPWTAGLVAVATGMGVLSRLDESSPYWLIATGLVPLGAGMGLAMTPATTCITDALPRSLQNIGSAMNDLARELGGALGIAVLGSLLGAAYRDRLELPGLPQHAVEAARSSLAAAHTMGDAVAGPATNAFTDGMRVALLGAAGAAAFAALAVAVLLRSSGRLSSSDEDTKSGPAGESSGTATAREQHSYR